MLYDIVLCFSEKKNESSNREVIKTTDKIYSLFLKKLKNATLRKFRKVFGRVVCVLIVK